MKTPGVAPYDEIEDAYEEGTQGRSYGIQNPSSNLKTVLVSPNHEIEDARVQQFSELMYWMSSKLDVSL